MVSELAGKPEERTYRSGRAFVTALPWVAISTDEAVFVRIAAFNEAACAMLLALDDGAWIDRDGATRPNLDLIAAKGLTAYHLKRRRRAVHADDELVERTP